MGHTIPAMDKLNKEEKEKQRRYTVKVANLIENIIQKTYHRRCEPLMWYKTDSGRTWRVRHHNKTW